MDMSLREWLVLIGLIIIAVVLIDGYRRMLLAKKRASELHFGLEEVKSHPELSCSGELPNGGARRQNNLAENKKKENFVAEKQQLNRIEPRLSESNFDSEGKIVIPPNASTISEYDENDDISSLNVVKKNICQTDVSKNETISPTTVAVPVLTKLYNPVEKHKKSQKDNAHSTTEWKPENIISEGLSRFDDRLNKYKNKKSVKQENKGDSTEKLSDRPPSKEVIIINVVAKGDHTFDGERLLKSVVSSGLRFGDMSIFHRYTNDNGTGKILFSMANGVEPGTFNIDKINGTSTPAVSFFMGLPGPSEQLKAFTKMVEVARQLALNLGGELKDEHYSVMTQQTIEHCRQRIIDFERKQLAHKLPS